MSFKPNLGDIMKQAKLMQEKMQEAQKELSNMSMTGEAGAGLVKVTLNGKYYARKTHIDDSLMNESKTVLEDLITAAYNDAVGKIEKSLQTKMANLASSLDLPKDLTGGAQD